MADGQVVLVELKPLGAVSTVRFGLLRGRQVGEGQSNYRCNDGSDEKVEAWGRLPEAAVKASD